MTEQDIWRWQEEMFIYSCYLYDNEPNAVMTDAMFDSHCKFLSIKYDKLSEEFKARVSKTQLDASTSVGLNYSEEEKIKAVEWYERVKMHL